MSVRSGFVDPVLLVEEDPDRRAETAPAIKAAFPGAAVVAAADPEDAVDRLDDKPVGVVITSVGPTDEGWSTILALADRGDTDRPIVLVVDGAPPGAEELPARVNSAVSAAGEGGGIGTLLERLGRIARAQQRGVEDHRSDRRATMEALYEASQELHAAATVEEVCRVAVETARRVLALPMSGIQLHDSADGVLEPAYVTDAVEQVWRGEPPTYTPADEAVWGVFESGELTVLDNVQAIRDDLTDDVSGAQSVVVAPLGDHGVLIASSPTLRELDEVERNFVHLLSNAAESALERAENEQQLSALHDATRALMAAPTESAVAEQTVETARDVLGLDFAILWHYDEEADALVPEAATDAVAEEFGAPPTLEPGDGRIWDAFEVGESAVFADLHEVDGSVARHPAVHSEIVLPLGEHGVMIVASRGVGVFTGADRRLLEILAANTQTAMGRAAREDRLRRNERQLNKLHMGTRSLMAAESHEEVATIASEVAGDILGMPLNGLHLYHEDACGLVPAGVSARAREVFGEPPTIRPGDGIAWQVFESGEPAMYPDVREAEAVVNPDTAIRSEIFLPLGSHGVLMASSTTPDDFEEEDMAIARVFAANVEAALDRADREHDLREREAEVRRQNERLQRFTSIVSHDLRNPLNVAHAKVKMVLGETDSDALDAADSALSRMTELIEDLMTLARKGESVGDPEPVAVVDVVEDAWSVAGWDAGRLDVESGLGRIRCESSRFQQLLENLFRNAREHGGEDVTVTVEPLPDGFAVSDDGPGIPAAGREAVFDVGHTTREDGTGLGLNIVSQIAGAHGWEVSAGESEAGGARFEVRGVERP